MTKGAAKVLNEALQLDENERAEIASELLASLQSCDDEVEEAWIAEINRRVAEAVADENGEQEEDWRTALARIEAEVLKR